MLKSTRFMVAVTVLLLAALACNLPSVASPTSSPNTAFTAAAQTVEAQLTQAVSSPTSTAPAPAATNTQIAATATVLSATSISPSPTATQSCDKVQFVKDVTIPDGSVLSPGESFTKTWRLKNTGTCAWSGYSLVFDSGDAMSGASPTSIGTVDPGQDIDISVSLKAPSDNGSYRGYWRIRNASGTLLAIQGGYQSKSFYVDIKVGSTGLDLYSRASSADWISCDDSSCKGGKTSLTFGGPDTDSDGFVMYRNGAELEDGSTPSKVLETHPKWVDDGLISGEYPAYTVQAGEHFKAKLGFLAKSDGTCGAGKVKFQLKYKKSGTEHLLDSWADSCDGSLVDVDVNLNSLKGENVKFILVVLANGSSSQDWAVWVNPRIEVP
jgi:hypothetical protein